MSNHLSQFDFMGIPVPYRPSEALTSIAGNGAESVREIPPAYVTNLETWLKTKSRASARNALLSITREALVDLVRQMGFRAWGWEAPTAVSQQVPEGKVYLDRASGRIVLNEFQAINRYIDSDGDRALVLPNENWTQCVLVKFPITSQPPILEVITSLEEETFHDFTSEMALAILDENPVVHPQTEAEILDLFAKKHLDVPVGLRTSAWNCFDLWESRQMSWDEKMEYIFNSFKDEAGHTQRSKDIEDAGMKAARKEGRKLEEAWVTKTMYQKFGASKVLKDEYAWALTSRGSIGSMNGDQVKWFDHTDLDTLVTKILSLSLQSDDFRNVSAGDPPSEGREIFHEPNLLTRLVSLKLVGWQEIKHKGNLPPTCLFWLQLPNGEPVALTDVKREDGRDEGLTYMFLLPPVWDNVSLEDAEGNPISIQRDDGSILGPARNEWVHPIDHLQKMLCTFDSCIRAGAGGRITGVFPRNLEQWVDPKWAVKVTMLYKWLSDYCGRYGDPAPAHRVNGVITPSDLGKLIASASVVIDYGRKMNHLDMFQVAKKAYGAHPFNLMGSKSTSRRVRKYLLANTSRGSCFDMKCIASPYRGGAQRSQLQRGLHVKTYRVAITKGDTLTQCFITPSGVEKQSSNEAFMPQVFNTWEAYQAHLLDLGMTAEDCPATEVNYRSWTFESRRCWVIGAQGTIHIGKLVDTLGQKFMPRGINQVFSKPAGAKDTEEIDLILPIQELVDKSVAHAMLQEAQEETIFLPDGSQVQAMVCNWKYVRTGASSENIPPRYRGANFKAIDSFPIEHQLRKIRAVKPRQVDTSFARLLQSTKREVKAIMMAEYAEE